MRERLVAAFVGLTVVVIVLYAVPRAYVLADQVRDQQQRDLSRSVELIARIVEERLEHGEPVTSRYLRTLLEGGERVRYVTASGTVVSAGAERGADGADLRASRPLSGPGEITLVRSGAVVDDRIAGALLPLVAVGIALVLVAGALGYLLAGRFSRPFRELADLARSLGEGRFDLDVPRYAVPEADEIGSALSTSSRELSALLAREREFAANASHQLRTPITALRLELEDLSMWPTTGADVQKELTRSLHELDRLSGAVNDLLDLARGHRLGGVAEVDLGVVVDQAVQRWSGPAQKLGRAVESRTSGPARGRLAGGLVAQILDVLIDNSLKHGRGTVQVATADEGTHLRLEVSDEGSVPPAIRDEIFRRSARNGTGEGEGIGLSVAREIAEALDGHLLLTDAPRTTFEVILPREGAGSRAAP